MATDPITSDTTGPDPSSYIRTFAKDYAAVSGKSLADDSTESPKKNGKKAKQAKPAKAPKPVKIKKERKVKIKKQKDGREQDEGVITAEVTAQEQADGEVLSQNDSLQALELPRIETGDIVSSTAASLAAALPDFVPPTPEPIQPEVEAVTRTPMIDERAAILSRLKAQVESSPVEIPVVPEAPVLQTEPSPLHTYKSDFSDHIDATHASKFSVLAAEKDAKPKKAKPVRTKRPANRGSLFAVLGAILLISLGAGGIFAAYLYTNKQAIIPSISTTYLITPDSQVKLVGSGPQLMDALADQANESLKNNSVELTYVEESTTTPQGVTEEPASGGAFITELQLPAPDVLLRNIDPSSMVGIVQAGTQTRPFFILKVLSYERTFAGMLQWEPSMLSDLSALYPIYPENNSLATSTDPTIGQNQPSSVFIDEIVSNHSVRALKDVSGRTIVLYGYADTQTLIIARDEAAFTLLLGKLQDSGK